MNAATANTSRYLAEQGYYARIAVLDAETDP